jgi:predicted ChrR family anti-sigma factor
MLGGVMFAHTHMQPVIEMIIKLAQKSAKEMREIEISDHSKLDTKIEKIIKTDVTKAYKIPDKKDRQSTLSGIKDKLIAELNPNEEINYDPNDISSCFKTVEKNIVRQSILKTSKNATARLLYIPAGSALPDHGHKGTELTLVIKGAFSDETARFSAGDVEVANEDIEHTPVAEIGEDCICLSATDAPLRFNGLVPRIVQPFLNI